MCTSPKSAAGLRPRSRSQKNAAMSRPSRQSAAAARAIEIQGDLGQRIGARQRLADLLDLVRRTKPSRPPSIRQLSHSSAAAGLRRRSFRARCARMRLVGRRKRRPATTTVSLASAPACMPTQRARRRASNSSASPQCGHSSRPACASPKQRAVQIGDRLVAAAERPVGEVARPRLGKRASEAPAAPWSSGCRRASAFPQAEEIGVARERACHVATVAQRRLGRLGDAGVALPAFVLELDMLDGDGVGVGVEIRQRLIFGDPAAVDLVGDHQLAGLVVEFEVDVLAEIGQRDLRAEPGAEVPHQAGPVVEGHVLGEAALERDASYLVRPGDLCDVEGSPPLRCSTTSVVRFSCRPC